MDSATIVARAGTSFHKSHVKHIQLAEERKVKGYTNTWIEQDFLFDYDDKKYRINEYIWVNECRVGSCTARYKYVLVELMDGKQE